MAETADPEAVLQAIIQTQEELKEQLAKDLFDGAAPGLPADLTAAPK